MISGPGCSTSAASRSNASGVSADWLPVTLEQPFSHVRSRTARIGSAWGRRSQRSGRFNARKARRVACSAGDRSRSPGGRLPVLSAHQSLSNLFQKTRRRPATYVRARRFRCERSSLSLPSAAACGSHAPDPPAAPTSATLTADQTQAQGGAELPFSGTFTIETRGAVNCPPTCPSTTLDDYRHRDRHGDAAPVVSLRPRSTPWISRPPRPPAP